MFRIKLFQQSQWQKLSVFAFLILMAQQAFSMEVCFPEDENAALPPVSFGGPAWGDYDNDGDLDLVLTGNLVQGNGGGNSISRVFKNDGNGRLIENTNVALTGVRSGRAVWGDYDRDGDLDLALAGVNYINGFTLVGKIYTNDGNGGFTENTDANLAGVMDANLSWVDYDGDNDLDLFITGSDFSIGGTSPSKIYKNNAGVFTEDTSISLPGVKQSSIAWADYDGDGDSDLTLTGKTITPNGPDITKIYKNDGSGGLIEDTTLSLPQISFGSIQWGDYDGDNDLDLFITGYEIGSELSRIYNNDGSGNLTHDTALVLPRAGGSTIKLADYDGDGDVDLFLTGSNGTSAGINGLYENGGNVGFTKDMTIHLPAGVNANLPLPELASSGADALAAWGDYDGDGDSDLIITGFLRDSVGTVISKIYKNTCSQTITFEDPTDTIYSPGGTFEAAANSNSELAVTVSSESPTVCSVSNSNTVNILTAGTCELTAEQLGDASFSEAANITQTVEIAKAEQVITFSTPPAQVYSQGGSFNNPFTSDSGLIVTLTSNSPTICSVAASGNTVDILTAGDCVLAASQGGNINYNPAIAVTDTVTIAKAPQTITFDDPADLVFSPSATFNAPASSDSGLAIVLTSTTRSVCTVAGDNMTVNVLTTGACSLTASQAGNLNYEPASETQSVQITKLLQTITFADPADIVFSAGATFTLTPPTSDSGLLPVTVVSDDTSVCTVSGTTVTVLLPGVCSLTATQAGNINYEPTTLTQTINIAKIDQTITFNDPADVSFSGAKFAPLATSDSGLNVVLAAAPATVCTAANNEITMVAVGTCNLTASQGGSAIYNAAASVAQSVEISKAAQTITFNDPADQVYSVGGTFTAPATSSSVLTVALASTSASVCTVSGNTVSIVAVGNCELTTAQAGNANYNAAAAVSQTVVIAKGNQAITFAPAPSVTFNPSGTFNATATSDSGLSVALTSNSTSVCSVSGSTVSILAAGACELVGSQAGNASFNPATAVSQTISIAKADQIIVFANPVDLDYASGATFNVPAASNSGLPVTVASNTASVCTTSANVASVLSAGICSLTATQTGDANYNPASLSRAVSIAKAEQIISVIEPSDLAYSPGGSFDVSASSSSGLPVLIGSTKTSICNVVGNTVTVVGAGVCELTIMQNGNANYAAAPVVISNVNVAKAAQNITFDDPADLTYSPGVSFSVLATSSSGLPVNVSSSTGGVCNVTGNTVSVVGAGSCVLNTSQPGDSNYEAALSTSRTVEVNKAPQTITFASPVDQSTSVGSTFDTEASASSGLAVQLSSSTPRVCSVSGNVVSVVGSGLCSLTASQPGDSNYNPATSVSGSLTLTTSVTLTAITETGGGASISLLELLLGLGLLLLVYRRQFLQQLARALK